MRETRLNGRTEFVYLLEWPDIVTKDAAWRAFLADPEWIEIERLTKECYGDLVGEIEERVLEVTDYSP